MRTLPCLLLVALAGCGTTTSYVRPNADLGHIKKVAVPTFENLSGDQNAGAKMRYIVGTALLAWGQFDLLEFGQLDVALDDAGLTEATSFSKDSLSEIGKKVGVDAYIMGTVQEYGTVSTGATSTTSVALTIWLVDVNSAEVLWQATRTKSTSVAARLFGFGEKSATELAQELVDELLQTLFLQPATGASA